MADTLKFGPEWLRNLSDHSHCRSQSPTLPTGRFKLAEHRYSKDEMLSMFKVSTCMPHPDVTTHKIFSPECQPPLNSQPITEAEQKLIMQLAEPTSITYPSTHRSSTSLRSHPARALDGSVRKMCGSGRLDPVFYKSAGTDEDHRGRHARDSWDDSFRSRNGLMTTQRSYDEGWRSRRVVSNEEQSWRKHSSKPVSKSWREPWEKERGGRDDNFKSTRRTFSSHNYDEDAELPEWSTDDTNDVGTFDASGAFMSIKDLEKMEEEKEVFKSKHKITGDEEDEDIKHHQDVGNGDGVAVKSLEKMSEASTIESVSGNNKEHLKEMMVSNGDDVFKMDELKENFEATLNVEDVDDQQKQQNTDFKQHLHNGNFLEQQHLQATQHLDVQQIELQQQQQLELQHLDLQQQQQHLDMQKQLDIQQQLQLQQQHNNKPHDKFNAQFDINENFLQQNIQLQQQQQSLQQQPSKGFLAPGHEDAHKWFYRDPQGEIQGPFHQSEMSEWFSAGYFNTNLLIKQGLDENFLPLGTLLRNCDQNPFQSNLSIPSTTSTSANNHVKEHMDGQAFIQSHLSKQQEQLRILQLLQQQQQQPQQQINNNDVINLKAQLFLQSLQQQQMATSTATSLQHNILSQLYQQQQQQQQMLYNKPFSTSSDSMSQLSSSLWREPRTATPTNIEQQLQLIAYELQQKQQQQSTTDNPLRALLQQQEALQRADGQRDLVERQKNEEMRRRQLECLRKLHQQHQQAELINRLQDNYPLYKALQQQQQLKQQQSPSISTFLSTLQRQPPYNAAPSMSTTNINFPTESSFLFNQQQLAQQNKQPVNKSWSFSNYNSNDWNQSSAFNPSNKTPSPASFYNGIPAQELPMTPEMMAWCETQLKQQVPINNIPSIVKQLCSSGTVQQSMQIVSRFISDSDKASIFARNFHEKFNRNMDSGPVFS